MPGLSWAQLGMKVFDAFPWFSMVVWWDLVGQKQATKVEMTIEAHESHVSKGDELRPATFSNYLVKCE